MKLIYKKLNIFLVYFKKIFFNYKFNNKINANKEIKTNKDFKLN